MILWSTVWNVKLFTAFHKQIVDSREFDTGIKFKNKYLKYVKTLLGGHRACFGEFIFTIIMETEDFSLKIWKNPFLSANLRFNLRFSKYLNFQDFTSMCICHYRGLSRKWFLLIYINFTAMICNDVKTPDYGTSLLHSY